MLALAAAGLVLWTLVLVLPWRPWSTRERLETGPRSAPVRLHDVTALIPARDEAAHIAETLRALAAQGEGLRIVVVDDESSDGTAQAALASGVDGLTVVRGSAPPPGWSGKLWALEQSRAHARSKLLLLLDADVTLGSGILAVLREKLLRERLGLVSLMVRLRMQGPWERCLLPAFVFFFKLLYPFRLANSPRAPVAAAAGGCVLVRSEALQGIGGFGALRGAIIDDCTLARHIKRHGCRTWIGLTRAAHSARPYPRLADVWNMVARSAYTQLRCSALLLVLCTLVMLAAFAGPLAGLLAGAAPARLLGAATLALMAGLYLPTVRYYGLAPAWALALPLAGLLFLAMTWASAWRCWRGERARWKGRSYARAAP